ncbi:MAG: alpha/beta fold hydrolase [Acidobacteriota bacterium]
MPRIRVNGVEISYEETGRGPQAVVFSHGLLLSTRLWDAQVAELSPRYRCIAYDHRGQGKSEVTRGGYDMDTASADAAALIEALGAAPCHFVGLSMGGFVGMRLAARRPDLVRSLCLLETSCEREPPENVPRYRRLAFVARLLGPAPVIGKVMPILFGRTFMTDPAREADRGAWRARLRAVDRAGAARATMGVITREGVRGEIASIRVPALVVVGDEDVATPPAKARAIQAAIPGSRLVEIPRAGHSSPVEQPALVTQAIARFLYGAT